MHLVSDVLRTRQYTSVFRSQRQATDCLTCLSFFSCKCLWKLSPKGSVSIHELNPDESVGTADGAHSGFILTKSLISTFTCSQTGAKDKGCYHTRFMHGCGVRPVSRHGAY